MQHLDKSESACQRAFIRGDYLKVTADLAALSTSSGMQVSDRTMYGISLLRLGHFQKAEVELAAAAEQGSSEAAVEYANLLRATGNQQRAAQQLTLLLPSLSGELKYRALRWLGVCENMLGLSGGLEHLEEARMGYVGIGDAEMAARLTQTISVMYALRGRHREALTLLDGALPVLERQLNQRPFLTALLTQADLQLDAHLYAEAQATLARSLSLSLELGAEYQWRRAMLVSVLAALLRGDIGQFLALIPPTLAAAQATNDSEVLEHLSVWLADHHSRLGDQAKAVSIMAELYARVPEPGVHVQIAEGVLARRRGDYHGSYRLLMQLHERAIKLNSPHQAIRASLQALYALYQMKDFERVNQELPTALASIVRLGIKGGPVALRPDMAELSELFLYAQGHAPSAPLLASILGESSELVLAQAGLFVTGTLIELMTLRQVMVVKDGVPQHLPGIQARVIVSILLYVALHPDCSLDELQTALFPERTPEAASKTVRRGLAHIETSLGKLIEKGGHYHDPTFRIAAKVSLRSDHQLVLQRAAEGNVIGMLAAFKGEFLPGLDESEWVQEIRSSLQASIQAALEPALIEAELRGAHAQVVRLCTQALRVLPNDLDLMERRIAAAQQAAMSIELARFQSELKHSLN
ncbi:hypothetical protein [Deinococcus ruber]|uniref:Bacterial transcriptional activator domain-containing protein n=1 Tax=Deinococcus ruber TaxID=1848197 RepID=A0A918C4D8_9DEIO|nr:hypothetical protein [Deinococcus ruber]GGR06002.1 hypothetical protein GCM10008957_18450 [Deinococcus ruber]